MEEGNKKEFGKIKQGGVSKDSIEQLIAAIDSELKGEFIQRHLINKISPSFPWNHRTLSNWDSQKIGVEGAFRVGKYMIYPKPSLMNLLRNRLKGNQEMA